MRLSRQIAAGILCAAMGQSAFGFVVLIALGSGSTLGMTTEYEMGGRRFKMELAEGDLQAIQHNQITPNLHILAVANEMSDEDLLVVMQSHLQEAEARGE